MVKAIIFIFLIIFTFPGCSNPAGMLSSEKKMITETDCPQVTVTCEGDDLGIFYFDGTVPTHSDGRICTKVWGLAIENVNSYNTDALICINNTLDLRITDNTSLNDLRGLRNLNGPVEHITIARNSNLKDLRGLEGLDSAHTLTVENNPNIESLDGLEGITSVKYLTVIGSGKLRNFRGLDNLRSIGVIKPDNDCKNPIPSSMIGYIRSNPVLESLDGLGSLAAADSLRIEDNPNLEKLLNGLSITCIPGVLSIANNKRLKSLEGLHMIKTVGINLSIENTALENMNGLRALRKVDGSLYINNNQELKNLDGLENLSRVNKSLYIMNNSQLQSIAALAHLKVIGSNGHSSSHAGYPSEISGNPQIIRDPEKCPISSGTSRKITNFCRKHIASK